METEQPASGNDQRTITVGRAVVAAIVGGGVAYLYLGRLRWAIALSILPFVALSIAGLSGVLFSVSGFYLFAALLVLAFIAVIVHCAVIARREPAMPARPFNRGWVYVLWFIGFALIGELLLQHREVWFGYESFRAPSASMEPTIARGDVFAADVRYFRDHSAAPGDLVIFELPRDRRTLYIKRVIGVSGDTIELRDDVVYRNGEPTTESYIQLTDGRHPTARNYGPVVVPDGHFFVMGDNRHNSMDSRFIGMVPNDHLVGRAVHRWFAWQGGPVWDRFPEYLR